MYHQVSVVNRHILLDNGNILRISLTISIRKENRNQTIQVYTYPVYIELYTTLLVLLIFLFL